MLEQARDQAARLPGEASLNEVLHALAASDPSCFKSHGAPCCRRARGWFLQLARTHRASDESPPRWITHRWRWGPSGWPIHWCDVVGRSELDCGALAALAEAALRATGARVRRVQLIEAHGVEHLAHWQARWAALPNAPRWIWGTLGYHEVIGVVTGEEFRLWDPSDGVWRESSSGADRIRAIRLAVSAADERESGREPLTWRELELVPGTWHRVP